MATAVYQTSLFAIRMVQSECARRHVLHPERARRTGPFVLAVTHFSHLDPIIVSLEVPRVVRWMARREFYRYRWSRYLLDRHAAFPVGRSGAPVSSIRQAIGLLGGGEVVGIFPEGGVTRGRAAAVRGGAIKRGACVIARRAGVPILPVVVLGGDCMTRISPWLPVASGRIWVNFGEPLYSDAKLPRRAARFELGDRLSAAFRSLYHELLQASNLTDAQVP